MPKPNQTDYAVAPGEYLAEWMDEHCIPLEEAAHGLGVSEPVLRLWIAGHMPTTTLLAERLERLTEIPATAWQAYEELFQSDVTRIIADGCAAPRTQVPPLVGDFDTVDLANTLLQLCYRQRATPTWRALLKAIDEVDRLALLHHGRHAVADQAAPGPTSMADKTSTVDLASKASDWVPRAGARVPRLISLDRGSADQHRLSLMIRSAYATHLMPPL